MGGKSRAAKPLNGAKGPEALNKGQHDFDLVSLQAPNLHTPFYQGSVDGKVVGKGYATYVEDYKLYLAALREIKVQAKLEKTRRDVLVLDEPGEVEYALMLGYSTAAVCDDSGVCKLVFKKGEGIRAMVAGKPSTAGPSVPFTGGEMNLAVGAPYNTTVNVKVASTKTVGAKLTTSFVEKVKGPAVTAKKVRTAAEIEQRAAKEKARREKSEWFASRRLALSKGKLEEKLAGSLRARASAISKVDASVTIGADLEGWRVVTHKKSDTSRARVKEVVVEGGKTTVRKFSAEAPV